MTVIIEIKVVPSSGRQECVKDESGVIKCYLKSAPEKGKANKELIKFLSKKLRVPQHNIAVISGATLRNKKIKIVTKLSLEEVYEIILKM